MNMSMKDMMKACWVTMPFTALRAAVGAASPSGA